MADADKAAVSSLTGVVISEGRLRAACALRVNKTAVLEDGEHQCRKTKLKERERGIERSYHHDHYGNHRKSQGT